MQKEVSGKSKRNSVDETAVPTLIIWRRRKSRATDQNSWSVDGIKREHRLEGFSPWLYSVVWKRRHWIRQMYIDHSLSPL